ncbi:methionine adenosyltransferase [Acetivibrio ethanolgignens]|uniref:methionine adenosyltransferase n=1 Tax=Acetivibrio ethanolgignens TaxID=290052 RepID=UPI0009F8C1C3|nr:methionine adenosyltransferase [Acetivibrio ethanolgignens]
MSRIYSSEQVSRGHVDKICDQIADAIVTDCLAHDKDSRVAIEVLIKNDTVVIAGEITTKHTPDYAALVMGVMAKIGIDKLGYSSIDVRGLITKQSPDIAMGVDKGGAGDQGIMYGYATNETAELLPMPFAVATTFIQKLEELDCPMFMPDAKAQVSYDYDTGKITTFLCSVQHDADADIKSVRKVIRSLMVLVASEYGLNTDFEMLVNPTGRFVIGGSKADCGVTGRKLACDTYGGIARIGGGALSGKDPSKVDRSAAYMARKIAVDLVRAGYCDKCEIQIAYAIGKAKPVSVVAETFGTAYVCPECIDRYIKANYDLTPKGIIKALHLLDVDYNLVSSGGHFGKDMLPWEMDDEMIDDVYGNHEFDPLDFSDDETPKNRKRDVF